MVSPPPFRPDLLTAARPLFQLVFRLVFRLHVEGLQHVPSTGAVLIAGNHSGLLDGPLVVSFAPRLVRVLAKAELYRGPLGRLLRQLGQIPVRRGRPDRAALRAAVAVLDAGGVLGVFPEGTRGSGQLERVQHGAAYVLMRTTAATVPVVPVVCVGTAEALPKGRRLPRWRAPVNVVFGAPVTIELPVDRHARSSVTGVAEQLRTHLLAHLTDVQGRTW